MEFFRGQVLNFRVFETGSRVAPVVYLEANGGPWHRVAAQFKRGIGWYVLRAVRTEDLSFCEDLREIMRMTAAFKDFPKGLDPLKIRGIISFVRDFDW